VYNKAVASFTEHLKYMDSIGYIPFDICETHRTGIILSQVDIVFLKKEHPINVVAQDIINTVGE